jgi:hypothetical protein
MPLSSLYKLEMVSATFGKNCDCYSEVCRLSSKKLLKMLAKIGDRVFPILNPDSWL